ncbi:MAG: hypothetical protein IKM48_01050 [Clostridia bacterium]|nr:hypothetical protein [Clostridia bacterium]
MCMIAGYNGTKEAAPILIEMMRKQEGLDGGFYTGIATFHEGKIYHAAACGDLTHLLETTNAAELPGTMGIIHTRTPTAKKRMPKEGALDEWAQPFISIKDGVITEAMLVNGCRGIFRESLDFRAVADELKADGYFFRSAHPTCGNAELSDGTFCHATDIRCQLTAKKIANGTDTSVAIEETYTAYPLEAASLLLSLSEPEAITYTRLVMPCHVAFADHGAFVASAPLAFPEETGGEYTLIPPMSSGKIYRNEFTSRKYKNPPATVAPITPEIVRFAYDKVEEILQTPHGFDEIGLGNDLKDLYAPADCTQRATVFYQILTDLERKGRVQWETRYAPGQQEGLEAPRFRMSLK